MSPAQSSTRLECRPRQPHLGPHTRRDHSQPPPHLRLWTCGPSRSLADSGPPVKHRGSPRWRSCARNRCEPARSLRFRDPAAPLQPLAHAAQLPVRAAPGLGSRGGAHGLGQPLLSGLRGCLLQLWLAACEARTVQRRAQGHPLGPLSEREPARSSMHPSSRSRSRRPPQPARARPLRCRAARALQPRPQQCAPSQSQSSGAQTPCGQARPP
mmetsp:Transcript_86091/g.221713  ORF Transcript_86091/g.221713 Transcript_86091/m.221713 type:complete len:212 (+) Transcript_86091:506-1141(+)